MLKDYRFKLIFNFSSFDISRHYEKLSAFEVLTIQDLEAIARPHLPKTYHYSDILKRSLCRPGTTWQPEAHD